MKSVALTCSRCKAEFEGFRDEFFTSGYYSVGEDSCWHRFAREGETILCDPCMWNDPQYMAEYSHDTVAAEYREGLDD